MIVSKIIYKLFPKSIFIALRKIYRNALKSLYPSLTEAEFRRILSNKLGIRAGSVVFVHASVDNLNIAFNTSLLLEILLETVGKNGTLVFPCWHFTYRAEEYLRSGKIFDVRRSPSALGMLSEMARRYPGAYRSLHPTNSIVAIGKYAEEITASHHTDIYPCGIQSPYYKAMHLGGTVIGIGVNAHFMSFVHCPEDVLKEQFPVKTRLSEVFVARVRAKDGSEIRVPTLAAHPQIKNNDINNFLKKHVDLSVSRNLTIKGNRFFIAHPKELFNIIVELSKEGKTIYSDKAFEKNF